MFSGFSVVFCDCLKSLAPNPLWSLSIALWPTELICEETKTKYLYVENKSGLTMKFHWNFSSMGVDQQCWTAPIECSNHTAPLLKQRKNHELSCSMNLSVDKMQIFDYFLSQEQRRKIIKRNQKLNEDELPRKPDATSHFYEEKKKYCGRENSLKKKTLSNKKPTTLRFTTISIKSFFKCKSPHWRAKTLKENFTS